MGNENELSVLVLYYDNLVHFLSFLVGLAGIAIIFTGIVRALWEFLYQKKYCFPHARLILGSHLVLGLDFFVGKDIIDTVVLRPTTISYLDLATLITVVGVRIILNYFLIRELKEIEKDEEEKQFRQRLRSKAKKLLRGSSK
jgi:uncharacterized membrane protein